MELVNFDKNGKVATIKISNADLVQIGLVLGGLRDIFRPEDSAILGIDEPRLKELGDRYIALVRDINSQTISR